jgi:hypothetical protein
LGDDDGRLVVVPFFAFPLPPVALFSVFTLGGPDIVLPAVVPLPVVGLPLLLPDDDNATRCAGLALCFVFSADDERDDVRVEAPPSIRSYCFPCRTV